MYVYISFKSKYFFCKIFGIIDIECWMNFKLYITNKFAWKMDNKLVDILIENWKSNKRIWWFFTRINVWKTFEQFI